MTLKNRLLLITIPVNVVAIVGIYLIVKSNVYTTVSKIETENTQNLLDIAMLSIKNQYTSLQFHKEYSLKIRETERKNVVDIVKSIIQIYYSDYKAGKLSKDIAQKKALQKINEIRYDNGNGYVWINDTEKPFPRMILHPIYPELNNKILSDSSYYSTPDSGNLFCEAVKICEAKGRGFIKYQWACSRKMDLEKYILFCSISCTGCSNCHYIL